MKKNSIFTQKDQPASQKIEVLRKKMTSQFRGIAEVVKEFIVYIADSPLLGQNAWGSALVLYLVPLGTRGPVVSVSNIISRPTGAGSNKGRLVLPYIGDDDGILVCSHHFVSDVLHKFFHNLSYTSELRFSKSCIFLLKKSIQPRKNWSFAKKKVSF